MSCTMCHTVFPELTPFGRQFKVGGFTFSSGSPSEPCHPPLAAMFQASLTLLQNNNGVLTGGVAPFDNETDSTTDKMNYPQQASLFYGGRIVSHFGALSQLTYDGTANDIASGSDRHPLCPTLHTVGSNLNVGFTLNNSPTVEDIWNSTANWGFPYAASAVAPTPAASLLIDGGLTGQVRELGIYTFWHNLVYGAFTVYRTTADGLTRPLGAGNWVIILGKPFRMTQLDFATSATFLY